MTRAKAVRSGSFLVSLSAVLGLGCPATDHHSAEPSAERDDGPGSANHDVDANARDAIPGVELTVDASAESGPIAALGAKLYVANEGSEDLTVIDALTSKAVGTIALGQHPHGMKRSPNGNVVYVALGESGGRLAVVDPREAKVAVLLPIGDQPQHVAVTPDGKDIYVSSEGSDDLMMVDLDKRQSESHRIGRTAQDVAVSVDGYWVYVTNDRGLRVDVLDAKTKAVVARVPLSMHPRLVVLSPDSKRAYVTTDGPAVAIVSLPENKVVKTIQLPKDARAHGLIFSTDGQRAYLTLEAGQVLAVDAKTDEIIGKAEVGKEPHGLAATADGKTLFVADRGSDEVSVVDAETMQEQKRIAVGHKPFDVVLVPDPG